MNVCSGGNANNTPIGKCSQCGGIVSFPKAYMSINRPVPQCESCGATVVNEGRKLPTIETKPVPSVVTKD